MFTVILRSVWVGIAFAVVAVFLSLFVGLIVPLNTVSTNTIPGGGGEMTWDLVSIAHDYPTTALLLPLIAFAIGYFIGFRYFSRSLAKY